jgi:hypothetical protein
MDDDRFNLGTRVVCIKPYEKLKIGGCYSIGGCGNLEWNMDNRRKENKTGYGFSVKYEDYDWKTKKTDSEFYYFTYEEMSEYFITENEAYDAYMRDRKIEEIIR